MAKSNKDAGLYGISRPTKLRGNEISSSSSLAFTSQLSSLIATSSARSERPPTSRRRPDAENIFTKHNKNSKKRALKDLDDAKFEQKHSTASEAVDEATWHRSKRKMEEKARLYAAMKRGDVEDVDEKYGVDFDRKWAEAEAAGKLDEDTSSGEDDGPDSEEETVEYVDEFGRTRTGTRTQAVREERRKNGAAMADDDRFTARPRMPDRIIRGDTIQSAAFNPDENISEQMASLAAKRDKEATPPPDEHFDGRKEVRTKGVGFFQFSGDTEKRKKQMDALEKERTETETHRADAIKRKEDRKRELAARKKAISEKRGKIQADRFLDGLSSEIQGGSQEQKDQGPKQDGLAD